MRLLVISIALLLILAAPAAPQPAAQPDLTTVKADFIPGEKTIFYDDFTDMVGDEPPPHWKVRGGAVALKVGAGVRQLTAAERVNLFPVLKGIPKNFTLETEVKFTGRGDLRSHWFFHGKETREEGEFALKLAMEPDGEIIGTAMKGSEELGRFNIRPDLDQPVIEALWVQNGRVRVYMNGQRVLDVNQVEVPPLLSAELQVWTHDDNTVGCRMVRLAESTPDFSQVISATGRYVSHGIHFDTDSDRLKPESAPVIKSIARGLEANPNLKLRIEGHTDSTGNAAHNLDLSKRRAEAVKAVLVSQFGVDAARLTGDGLGAAKPIDSNDTPQGRAQNRRVEFVRQ